MTDARLQFPATARNRAPILDVLRARLPAACRVLEIGSGSGEHAVHFCADQPGWTWQPTDRESDHLASIEAWRAASALPNLARPLRLDVLETWPALAADVVFCANMIHIAPWAAGRALLAGAATLLPAGGPLVLYGPFRVGGAHTSPSNEDFDASLRARDPSWGVRDLEEVVAAAAGFTLEETVQMPANNLIVRLRRQG